MNWFKANKEDLQKEHPEATGAELTKFGMRIYKSLTASGNSGNTSQSNGKRKLDDSGSEEKTPGVSKLAKFGFSK